MPRVSAFRGIVITMYFDEETHPGRPHFHARFAGRSATYDIETLGTIVGGLPRSRHRLVVRWADIHRDELRRNWLRCRVDCSPMPIDPLP